MPVLMINLLGPLTASNERGEPVVFPYDKVQALLAYLVFERDRAHPRSRLAGLFWPERPESAARHSLSQALSTLRSAIGDDALIIERKTIQFNADADCWVDLLEFDRLLQDDQSEAVSPFRQQKAVSLYRGEFLEGISLEDCPEFEDWLRTVQETTRRTYASALEALVEQLESRNELRHACEYAQQLVDLDPWEERNHRLLMRLLASNGRRSAAIRQYELCAETLNSELGLDPELETRELAERIKSGLEGSVTLEPRSHVLPALPAPTSPTIGREDEIALISQHFRNEESRLVTLIGPGGIGKSRLALEVARSVQSEFVDGVHVVPLAGVQSQELIAPSILAAVSAQVDPHGDPVDQLRSFLSQRNLLLLLDNFEHLLNGAGLLSVLLESAPELHILATSRERLSLSSESVFEVEGLSLPENEDAPSIATSGAARLFMLRARKHKASFLPRREDGPAIARIAHLTGGMPLGIELAAAWIPVLSPEEIAYEIEQSLDFLSVTMRDVPARHQSVRAVVDRSWENLTAVEQRAFRRLAVFQGSFTREAVWYVTGASLPVLSALVSKSLLRHNQQGRYEIHQLLRQYATEQLERDSSEATGVKDRFRDYFIGFLAVREEQMQDRMQARVITEVTAELENIRAAWQRAVETDDHAGISRVAHCLWLYFEITGRYREGVAVMHQALEALELEEDDAVLASPEYRMALSRVRSRWASLGFRMYGPGVLLEQAGRALQDVRSLDEPGEVGMLLNFLSVGAHALGDLEAEEEYLSASIEQFKRAGHRWGLAYSTNDLGHVHALKGDYEIARDRHKDALTILEELGDRRGIAFALRNLGIVASRMEEPDLALQLLRRSVDIRRPIGNRWGIADSLNQIGVLLRDSGDLESAAEYFREALQIAQEIRAMQLAAEILREYRPLLPDDLPDGGEDQDEGDFDQPASGFNTAQASRISWMVELVLQHNQANGSGSSNRQQNRKLSCEPSSR